MKFDKNLLGNLDKTLYEININIKKNVSYNQCVAKILIKEVISKSIHNWLVINGLVYNKSIHLSTQSKDAYHHYYWHLFAKSFMLDSFSKGKDVYVVADILQNDFPLNLDNATYYSKKVDSVRGQSSKANFLPILIADFFDKEALQELRKKKIMATTIKNLLGEETSNLLKELQLQISNINEKLKDEPNKIFEITRSLNKTVGLTDNLKGKLFEYFIATISLLAIPNG